jgi:hypothetical protein
MCVFYLNEIILISPFKSCVSIMIINIIKTAFHSWSDCEKECHIFSTYVNLGPDFKLTCDGRTCYANVAREKDDAYW